MTVQEEEEEEGEEEEGRRRRRRRRGGESGHAATTRCLNLLETCHFQCDSDLYGRPFFWKMHAVWYAHFARRNYAKKMKKINLKKIDADLLPYCSI